MHSHNTLQMVSDTADIICLPKADCMLLLQHMKWDDQKLKGLYFDKEATVRNAGITLAIAHLTAHPCHRFEAKLECLLVMIPLNHQLACRV